MRLTQIKLSGFKSFVDTTVIPTPSQMVGVVGPNGCGKSNIIDAVRWVLGESRASELRGGSMQDVIFNGSGQRKPAARASVELTFSNDEGRLRGQWGAYTEISVRRELTRDGASGYFINGQQVRRRDIHDIFLGTGLGARGYAIIGQGMINRLIEAKPEELRVYLEEAAGVSRYKERRKETESRLRDTRENLTRLEDILQELALQLERLTAQAEVAKQYKEIQREGEKKQHVLWWLREKNAREEQKKQTLAIEQAQTAVEAAMADVRSTETRLEQLRQKHISQNDMLQVSQAALYQSNAEVSRLEAEIRHANTAHQRKEQRQEQLRAQQKEWEQLHADSLLELEQKQEDLFIISEQIEEALAKVEELAIRLEPSEKKHDELLQQRENLSVQLQQLRQQQALAQQRAEHSKQQKLQVEQRKQRFTQDLQTLQQVESLDLHKLEEQCKQAQLLVLQEQQLVAKFEQRVSDHYEQEKKAHADLSLHQAVYTQIEAQIDALSSLQEQVQRQGQLASWLEQMQLVRQTKLWQVMQVKEGWETAVEAVLGFALQGVAVDNWQLFLQGDLPPARFAAYRLSDKVIAKPDLPVGALALRDKVQVKDYRWQSIVDQLLDGFIAMPALEQAIKSSAKWQEDFKIVVPQGHIFSTNALFFYAADSEQAGVLERQQKIEIQRKALKAQAIHVEHAKDSLQTCVQLLMQTRAELSTATVRLHEQTQRAHEKQLVYQQAKQQAAQQQQRRLQVKTELEEMEGLLIQYQKDIKALEINEEQNQLKIEEILELLEEQQETLQAKENLLRLLREQLREAEQRSQQLTYNKNLLQARVDELLRSQQQALDLMQRAQHELAGLVDEYEDLDINELHLELQEALEQRVLHEEAVQQAQQVVADIAQQLQQLEQSRHQTGDGIEPLRQRVTELQLAEQAARITIEQYAEQLDMHQVDRQAIALFMSEQNESWTKVSWLQAEVQRLHRELEGLGAVNLAALEELQTAQERQFYLQSQQEDLLLAIETLEDAIRRIDRETRALLQTTFNEVNQHFGELFPQLFGGGEAKLIMTGQEVLDAGVQVMAQPPGKRNSTIQLLSGGEKALTATALVFAFFKLNPAPFCLLDEVDAPLDDANTERYAKLVASMSEQTQFLFISHNKIAMQMAKQLVGVTMQEQGVSRIVAVDMASAIEMAH